MHKMILMMALAGIAAPALADPPEGHADHRAAKAEQRAAPAPRPGPPHGGGQHPQAVGAPQAMQAPRGGPAGPGGWHGGFQPGAPGAPQPNQGAQWHNQQNQARAQQFGGAPPPPPPGGWNRGQPGQMPPGGQFNSQYGGRGQFRGQAYNGQQGGPRWSNNWRQDPRYDWRGWREQNRTIFRVGIYTDPFGYSYRPLSVGFMLYSGYYAPNYWLSDPYEYRLPPAYGPYRWVRYYNDAVLVDIYTGQVVDVLQGFFW